MKSILVIDDNNDIRENTAEILSLAGFKTITAENGKKGVEAAIKNLPDLIICDIMMPELDGYGVLHLLGKHIETYGIPFIFLTAKSEKSDLRKGMELGADDYITKPFDGIELLKAVEIRLQKSDAVRKHFAESSAHAENMDNLINDAGKLGKLQLTSDEREVYDYKKKQVLYSEGQRPKAAYYIRKGKVKIYKTNEDGKELITNILTAGDFLGYTYILEEINYKENAEVLEDAEIMKIPKDDFISLVTNDTQIAKQFIKIITHNVIEKEESLLNLAYSSLRRKVAFQLLHILDKFKSSDSSKKELRISRENLAQVAGIATESLIRTLSDFKSEKLIDIQSGTIIVLNENKLRDLPF